MICPTCGAENELGRKFCLECGQRLAVVCATCASSNTPGAKFCGECGSPLTDVLAGPPTAPAAPTATAATAAAPATQRRLVSVLFADLVGFTTLSENRDAEDVRELLARYFEICREIIGRYGGTVEKFIGDAVMAVWGTPTAQEDDAERAVRAALDLVEAVEQIGGAAGIPDLALRAGVQTGEAVVMIGATGMGMVAGDLVNTASRLQSVAAPGSVLVGEGTRRAAGTAIAFEDAGAHELKGKAVPVSAFRAVRVVAQRRGVGRSDGLEPPFVGRDAELRLIKDFYHATARDPGPRLVSVIGQAGIGKSRLLWEFQKYIDGVTQDVYWHQGRSPAYGDGISFWALGEMVRMRLRIGEAASEYETRERLTSTLEEFVPDPGERRSLTEPLLHLIGIGDAGGRDGGQLFVAWRTFFERIAEAGPVVMVFEDVQWADDGLIDFIEDLLAWSRNRSIYIITLARPELLDRRPTWGAGHRSFTSLSLAPLADDEMRALLVGLVPGLPDALISQIVARSEGIPLYAVEMVRTLLNDGRIERSGDVFGVVGDVSQLAVPESLQGLIAARIDALPPAERTLVQDASVLGLSFADATLRAVARAGAEELAPMLQHLVQREVLVRDDDARSPERGLFRFVQSLLREVAYATLSRDDRRSRHLAAARYYEAQGDEELSGVLAQHYVDAYRAHPDGPEGAAVAAQARVALRGAAQRAGDLGSHRTAHAYLNSALSVVADPAEELDLRSMAASAATNGGLLEASAGHLERVIALATQLGRTEDRRLAIAELADVLVEGHQQRALALLNDVMSEPGMEPGAPGYAHVATVLAKTEMRQMNNGRAIELADRALPVVQETRDPALVIELLVTRAVSLANVGRSTEAVVILTGALAVARRLGLFAVSNRAAVNLGYALAPDDPQLAFEISREAFDAARRDGVVWAIRYILGNAVDAAIEVGEWDWAMAAMADVDALFTEPAERMWFGTYAGVIRALRGEDVHAEARALYESARHVDDSQYRALGAFAYVVSSLLRGEYQEVVRLTDEVTGNGIAGLDSGTFGARAAIWAGDLETARRLNATFSPTAEGRRQTALIAAMEGGIAMLEGRVADARAGYSESLRRCRELGVDYWLAMTGLDIAITGAAREADDLRAAVDEAREIFTRLGAIPLLDRLERAVAATPPRAGRGSARGEESAVTEILTDR